MKTTLIPVNKRFKSWTTYPAGYSTAKVINGITVEWHWVSRNIYSIEPPHSFFWGYVIRVPDGA